jgi:hypothetical protein
VDTDYGDWIKDGPSTAEIDTRLSLDEVVDALERIAAATAPNG